MTAEEVVTQLLDTEGTDLVRERSAASMLVLSEATPCKSVRNTCRTVARIASLGSDVRCASGHTTFREREEWSTVTTRNRQWTLSCSCLPLGSCG